MATGWGSAGRKYPRIGTLADAVGNQRGGLRHGFEMNELPACDQMRAHVIVQGCEPATCPPPLAIDDRDHLFEVLLDDRSPR